MKILLLSFIFLSLGFAPCKNSKQAFEILSAEKQRFAGGTKFSSHGIKYKIKVKTFSTSAQLSFDSLLVPHRILSLDFQSASSIQTEAYPLRFKKNDTIVLSFTHTRTLQVPNSSQNFVNDENEIQSGQFCDRSLGEAEAILYFTFKRRKGQVSLKSFTLVPSLLYP